MRKVVRLTERDLTRIVKRVINENSPNLGDVSDDLRNVTRRLTAAIDEYKRYQRNGDYKKMGDELDTIRHLAKKLRDISDKISKL